MLRVTIEVGLAILTFVGGWQLGLRHFRLVDTLNYLNRENRILFEAIAKINNMGHEVNALGHSSNCRGCVAQKALADTITEHEIHHKNKTSKIRYGQE